MSKQLMNDIHEQQTLIETYLFTYQINLKNTVVRQHLETDILKAINRLQTLEHCLYQDTKGKSRRNQARQLLNRMHQITLGF